MSYCRFSDESLYQAYLNAEHELAISKATNRTYSAILPALKKANEAWRACYRPALIARTEQQQAIRREAIAAVEAHAHLMTSEQRAAIFQTFGISLQNFS